MGVNLAIGMIGLILLEVIFGSWFSPHRLSRLALIRNETLYYDAGSLYPTGGQKVVYRRDRYGLRTGVDPSSIDILTVGGSATDQRYVTEGKTWQDVLIQDFAAAGQKVHVANAGIDGQSTFGHIKDFEWWFPQIPGLKVKWFLFYVGGNDFYRTSGYKFDRIFRGAVPLKNFVKDRSAFYSLYRMLRGIFLAESYQADHRFVDFKTQKWTQLPLVKGTDPLDKEQLQAYGERLRMLVRKVKEWNARPIFVTQASRRYKKVEGKIAGVAAPLSYGGRQINGVDYYRIMRAIHGKTLEVCAEAGGLCIDLDHELAFDDEDFYDYTHTTPRGSEKIGHYLYRKLTPLQK